MKPKKLKLKVGPVEVEFEGEELPAPQDLYEIVAAAADVYKAKQLSENDVQPASPRLSDATKLQIQGSTASIAARLNCVSGPELIIAAAARLTFVEDEEWFEPNRLLEEMKSAAAHFEGSYQPALKEDLLELVKSGKLVEVAPNLFALTATMRRELLRALAE